jgi:recombination protein RecT
MNTLPKIKSLLTSDAVKGRFEEILGNKSVGFISSVLNVVSGNKMLQEAEPNSVMMSAAIAATLDLPINPSLGFAAIVPYRNHGVAIAQFQIMWRGLVQLAQRSGQYKTLHTTEVYDGEISSHNRFTGEINFDESKRKSSKIIGYVAYFKLINGFEKPYYMTVEEVEKHAKKYSQTYKAGKGKWVDDFDSMAKKTVLKLLLSKYGIMSVDMQNAVKFDQSHVKGDINKIEEAEAIYMDNDSPESENIDQRTPEQKKEDLKGKQTTPPVMP